MVESFDMHPYLGAEPPTVGANRDVWNFYIIQFLASWGLRSSEYSLSLFLAIVFPETLLYISLYGLVRSFVAVSFSSEVGAYVDRANRLRAIQMAIAFQRIPTACSCLILIFISQLQMSDVMKTVGFSLLLLMASLEKLASIANVIIIERDWAIVVSEANSVSRQGLNATLRRVDLICKLVAPIVISLVEVKSPQLAMFAAMVMNVASLFAEFSATNRVYYSIPELAIRTEGMNTPHEVTSAPEYPAFRSSTSRELNHLLPSVVRIFAPWKAYARSPAFLASLSNAILYWTVLSFGGQMVVYLLSTGFDPLEISGLRMASVLAELGGTWIAPALMAIIGPVRTALWCLMWQLVCIAAFGFTALSGDIMNRRAGGLLAFGITLKRLGLWGSDLAIQFIVQEKTPPASRAQFSATEMACQNLFEVLSSASTVLFPQLDDFKYPILISYAAIAASTACHPLYVQKTRGHLLHTPSYFIS